MTWFPNGFKVEVRWKGKKKREAQVGAVIIENHRLYMVVKWLVLGFKQYLTQATTSRLKVIRANNVYENGYW